jgi:hypothetical protein
MALPLAAQPRGAKSPLRIDGRGLDGRGRGGRGGAERDPGDAGGGEVGAGEVDEGAGGERVHRLFSGLADGLEGGEVGGEGHVEAVGAGLVEGADAAQGLVHVVGAGHDAVGAGDEDEVGGERAGGGGGGADARDRGLEGVGLGGGERGVLDRGAGEAGFAGEADGVGDVLGVVGVAVLEVGGDRQGRRGGERRCVSKCLIARDLRAVGQAQREGVAGRGGADRRAPRPASRRAVPMSQALASTKGSPGRWRARKAPGVGHGVLPLVPRRTEPESGEGCKA